MPSSEFEAWWAELQREPGMLRDSHDTARRLGRRLDSMQPDRQRDFLDQLVPVLLQRHRAYGIALFLLDHLSDPAVLLLIAEHLRPLPDLQTHDEEAHLADLIRVLAAARDKQLLPPVEAYLVERSIGGHWATVPWALWPHEPELFARAWERFFREREPGEWTDPLVLRSFLGEANAIAVVRERLAARSEEERWPVLRDALREQAQNVSWLPREQLATLERILG